MRSIALVMAMARVASADAFVGAHAGGGLRLDSKSSGESSSLLVGGSLRTERPGRRWSPIYTLDVRVLEGDDQVMSGDHTQAFDTRGVSVRGLAGIRYGSWCYAQVSAGFELQRATWEESYDDGTPRDLGRKHETGAGLVLEPAIGLAPAIGRFRLGVQLAASGQTNDSSFPIRVNESHSAPLNLFVTAFVESRL